MLFWAKYSLCTSSIIRKIMEDKNISSPFLSEWVFKAMQFLMSDDQNRHLNSVFIYFFI